MPSSSLFACLTGYEEPSAGEDGVPQVLGADGTEETDSDEQPSEAIFDEILERLQNCAKSDPLFSQKLADAFGVPNDSAVLAEYLLKSREIVAKARESTLLGAEAPDWPQQEEALQGPELLGVPGNFSESYLGAYVDPRYRDGYPPIELDPKVRRFEDDSALGILGWMVFNGPGAIEVPRSASFPFPEQFGRILGAEPFRRHGPKRSFVYQLEAPAGGSRLRTALFADFGTGLAHSRFIARQIQVDGYQAAVHLGDVYYTGASKEYREYFEKPLSPVIANNTRLFVIPDNHDGYSGFHAYVDFMNRQLEQQGSYFAIETPRVQLIGVDTIWHGDRGRIEDPQLREWLSARFKAGRAAGRANVLLTGHEPYSYGDPNRKKLNQDVLSLANGSIDLWFWGNTHYCALFNRTDETPYYGSCIGHAGYPFAKTESSEAPQSAAPVLFVEAGSRYEGSNVRTDRGMNGFCSLEVEPGGGVEVRYLDWRGHERCVARFEQRPNGSLALSGQVEDHTL